jgi:hypothetical protein
VPVLLAVQVFSVIYGPCYITSQHITCIFPLTLIFIFLISKTFFSFIHMCIQSLGHFSPLPPAPSLTYHFLSSYSHFFFLSVFKYSISSGLKLSSSLTNQTKPVYSKEFMFNVIFNEFLLRL